MLVDRLRVNKSYPWIYEYELQPSRQRQYEYDVGIQIRFEGCILYYAKYTCFRRKCLNVDADFKRVKFCTHICVSTPRRDLRGWFSFFFRRICFWCKEVQISQIILYQLPGPCKKKTVRSGLRKGFYETFATFHSLILECLRKYVFQNVLL